MKYGMFLVLALLYIKVKVGELWPRGSSWGTKILKVVKKFVTLFSYIVCPRAIKCGSVTGLGN